MVIAYIRPHIKGMSNRIESLQLRIMKIVFGITVAYYIVLEQMSIKTLQERCQDLLLKFAQKTAANPKFNPKWFPLARNTTHDTRKPKK